MKSLLILVATVIITGTTSIAQKIPTDSVPLTIQKAFFIKYPDIKDAKWEKMNNGSYKAEFNDHNAEWFATFNSNGRWSETNSKIDASILPAEVTKAIGAHFVDYTIKSADETDTFENGSVFKVIITKDKVYKEVVIKPSGEIVSKTIDKAITN